MLKQYNASNYMVRLEITKDISTDQDRLVEILFQTICTFLEFRSSFIMIATHLFTNTLGKLTYIMERLVEVNAEHSDSKKVEMLQNLALFAEHTDEETNAEDSGEDHDN